jgi:hypothetical protein
MGRDLAQDFLDVMWASTSRYLYYDQVELLTQLGLMPARAAAAS